MALGLLLAGLFASGAQVHAQNADEILDPNGVNDEALDDTREDARPQVVTFDSPIDDGSDDDSDDAVDDTNGDNDDALRNTTDPTGQLRNNRAQTTDGLGTNERVRRADQVGTIGPDGRITPLANTRVVPEQGPGTVNRVDPYTPLGIRLGTFTLSPEITQTFGYTTNADSSSGGTGSGFSQTDIRLNAISNWSVHELRAGIGGSFQKFFNGTSENLPSVDANIDLRLDHNRGFTSRFGASYNLTTESAVSDNLTVPPPLTILERPDVKRYSAYVELAKQSGRLNTSLRGTVTYSVFDGADLSDGSRLPQGDRTNTLYELEARASYEASPVYQPFVEASVGTRRYFRKVDRNGNVRDSLTYALRGGVAFDRGEKLSGEFALGYATENFEDSAINDLSGLTVDAAVNWSPQRLTTVSATAQTAFTGSTNANEAGSVTYTGTLGVVHDIRPNLSLNANVQASIQDFDGSGRQDTVLQAQAGAEWRINRNLSLIGTIGHEITRSSEADASFEATTARIGLRWRK